MVAFSIIWMAPEQYYNSKNSIKRFDTKQSAGFSNVKLSTERGVCFVYMSECLLLSPAFFSVY